MVARITVVALLLLTASSVSSADFTTIHTVDFILENRNGQVVYFKQPAIIKKLYRWLKENTEARDPLLLAELLAATDYPCELAGIYKIEGCPHGDKVGRDGELGPFQILPENLPADFDPFNLPENVKRAEELLSEYRQDTGSVREAVRAYNGSSWNPKARAYRDRVMMYAREVRRA